MALVQRYGDQKYKDAALECAEVIWQRGLLKKGYGLCHGVAGNAYAFLCAFKLSGDEKYLNYACQVRVKLKAVFMAPRIV